MKVKLLLVGTLAVAVVLAGVCYNDYRQSRVASANRAHTTQQAQDAKLKDMRKQYGGLITKYNALWEQCSEGQSAYNLLPPASKAKVKAPNCGLTIVE